MINDAYFYLISLMWLNLSYLIISNPAYILQKYLIKIKNLQG